MTNLQTTTDITQQSIDQDRSAGLWYCGHCDQFGVRQKCACGQLATIRGVRVLVCQECHMETTECECDDNWSQYSDGLRVIPLADIQVGSAYRIYDQDGLWMDGTLETQAHRVLFFRVGKSGFYWSVLTDRISEVCPIEQEWEI